MSDYRYARLLDFNPHSHVQVGQLIRSLGLKMPHKRGEDRETTEAKYLKRFSRKYPIFKLILDCRERQKLLTTYNWPLDAVGRVHTTYGFHPSTWRKSSRNVNLQNIPKRSDLAGEFRRMLVAAPGHFLIEADACVDPACRVLKADLSWVRADAVCVGDELIGFDEDPHKDNRFRSSLVLATRVVNLPRVRVHTTQGTIIVSTEHPFLARYSGYKRRWIKAGKLRPGARIAFLAAPWEVDDTREAGYLAGFFDGEGWCTRTKVGFGQNVGPTLDYVQALLYKRGFAFNFYHASCGGVRPGKTQRAGELPVMREALRFLGTIRPPRLMLKARGVWEGRRTWGKRTLVAQILAVEPLDSGPVVAIQTAAKTYISEGMFSHNSAIEAVLVGYNSGSAAYIRLARAGVHGWLTSHIVGSPISEALPDAQLTAACRSMKKLHAAAYEAAKRCIHGSNYLLSARGMHDEYEEYFPTEADARALQNLYFSLPAGREVRAWQQSVIARAHKENFLETPFGVRHYFFACYQWDSRTQSWKLGEDAKRAVAFLPQSEASSIQDLVLLQLAANPAIAELPRLLIHDSIVLEAPESLVNDAARTLEAAMVAPIPQLAGLTIGCQLTVGRNFAPFDPEGNPDGMRTGEET